MRLMGIAKLERLAKCGGDGVSGAIAALLSELEFAQWRSEADLSVDFPLAACSAGRARIPIGEAFCVDLVVRYDIGMVLIEFAGAKAAREIVTTRRQAV